MVVPVVGMVLESILNARLGFRNINLDMNDPFQFRFKANSKIFDNLFILHSLVNLIDINIRISHCMYVV